MCAILILLCNYSIYMLRAQLCGFVVIYKLNCSVWDWWFILYVVYLFLDSVVQVGSDYQAEIPNCTSGIILLYIFYIHKYHVVHSCLHGSWTCTELSGHWCLFILIFLAMCARLSSSLGFLVHVNFFFRLVSYHTVSLPKRSWNKPQLWFSCCLCRITTMTRKLGLELSYFFIFWSCLLPFFPAFPFPFPQSSYMSG